MKTCIVTACYLHGKDPAGNDRFERTIRWVKYNLNLLNDLQADCIYILDNASRKERIEEFKNRFTKEELDKIQIISFENHLGRPSALIYHYVWRALYYLVNFFDLGYNKIIYMDSDFYILSKKMTTYIRELQSGWTEFWCNMYNFPEPSCHILFENTTSYLDFIKNNDYIKFDNMKFEEIIPVTHIEKGMIGDRYGEVHPNPKQNKNMDYYAQTNLSNELKYESN